MAPKNAPPAAKQTKILDWFKETMGVYTFKDLEKLLPSVASINGMQVKDYLQALTDESLIRCEKIGSGNWYWCFMSDAKKSKENMINTLKGEEGKLVEAIKDTQKQIEHEMTQREEDEEMLEGGGMDRKVLLEMHEGLLKEMHRLDKELGLYCDADSVEVLRKIQETKRLKESAIKWTDNIDSMESYLLGIIGDRAQAAGVMQQACGGEYVLGEGLKELCDL